MNPVQLHLWRKMKRAWLLGALIGLVLSVLLLGGLLLLTRM